MPSIRALRLSRGMTLVELALKAGIPARTLGAIEQGLLHLDDESAARLASSLGVALEQLSAAYGPTTARPAHSTLHRMALPLSVALISGLLLTLAPLREHALANDSPAATQAAPATAPMLPTPTPKRRSTPTATAAPRTNLAPTPASEPPTSTLAAPTPLSAFRIEADGPHGCPLIAAGSIVITQGYGEGSHVPSAIWGAIDLAVDSDGDGVAEPAATDGLMVVATHAGVARVFPMSWPGGNFVLIEDAPSGWSTGYAHLSSIAVSDGQLVAAGAPLGTVGSTGQASGPHLHYEVRHGGV